jgi:DNA-binding transcriptional ArsR family regulator
MGLPQDPVKNIDIEEHFGALGSGIRVEILKRLDIMKIPLSFGELAKYLTPQFNEGLNLSYHLKKLKDIEAIFGNEEGYQLTPFGQRLVQQLLSFEDIIISKNSSILIRTSRYKLEEFDETIIERKLIEEAAMPTHLAKRIASEAKRRLLSAKVTYLTSPLIREYVNAILIENQMEDYRHKLTRLGLPAYDIKMMINSNQLHNPTELKIKLGKATLEQYTLLNQLSQGFADKLLTTEFIITDLERFGLSPLEFGVMGGILFDVIMARIKTYVQADTTNTFLLNIFEKDFTLIFQIMLNIAPYGVFIIRFDEFIERFLSYFSNKDLDLFFNDCIQSGLFEKPITFSMSLDVNLNTINPIIAFYEKRMAERIEERNNLPVFQIYLSKERVKDFTKAEMVDSLPPLYSQIFNLSLKHNINLLQYAKWGSPNIEIIFSNLQNPITYDKNSSNAFVVLEKIHINLIHIWQRSGQNDARFLMDIEKAIFSTFDYYELKYTLLAKNMQSFKDWRDLCQLFSMTHVFDQKVREFDQYKGEATIICPLVFIGLEKVQKERSGYYTKDLAKNREFAKQIYDSIANLLNKHNSKLNRNIRFVLSEACNTSDHILDKNIDHPTSGLTTESELKPDHVFECDPFILQTNLNTLCNVTQIYSDFKDSKYEFFSVNLPFKREELGREQHQRVFEQFKTLFQFNIARIGIDNEYFDDDRQFKRKLDRYRFQDNTE